MVAGVITGYAVQYDRDPTPLPPLSQPDLRDPKAIAAGPHGSPQSLHAHRRAKTDGDLRRLLVKKPAGARSGTPTPEGWKGLVEFAQEYREPDRMFRYMAEGDFRRIATTSWSERGEVFVTVNLIQFRDDHATYAEDWVLDQQSYLPRATYAGNDGKPIPGSGNGRVYVYDEPHREPGYEPVYQSRVLARRGDVVMDIWYSNNTRRISEKAVMSIAKQQLGRL
ncbi:hypothetical protein [Streptomyces sp. NPDC054887]